MRQALQVALAGLTLIASGYAQDPSGHYEGVMRLQNRDIKFSIDLLKEKAGWAGQFSFLGAGPKELPLDAVKVEAAEVSFAFSGVPNPPVFKGKFDPETKIIAGTAKIREMTADFELTRTADAKAFTKLESTVITKELAGKWEGAIEAGRKLRLILTITAGPDGIGKGVLTTLDQGNVEIPVTAVIQKADSVEVVAKVADARYVATLKGNQLTGEYFLAGKKFPLTMTKAAQ